MNVRRRRGLRIGLVVVLTLGVVVALGWHRGFAQYGGVYGFEDVAVGETVYAAVGHAETALTVRRVAADTVGPIEVVAVRCPDEQVGSLRTCPGGPLPATGVPIGGGPARGDVEGDAIVVLAVTRTGPSPAAVCGVRVLHTAGLRAGLTQAAVRIELPAVGEELPDDEVPGIAWRLCE